MPTKCIDQMPQPIDTAPPTSQSRAVGLCVLRATREDRFSAVWETKTATAIERRTSPGLYTPTTAACSVARPGLGQSRDIGHAALHLRRPGQHGTGSSPVHP